MPRGLRELGAYGIGYGAQTWAYFLLLTERYPNSDPDAIGPVWELPPHHGAGSPSTTMVRRSRLTAFFRLLLAIPHFVWLALWTVAAFLAAIANVIVALVRGRSADALHRFLAAYVRYDAHVTAFATLVANPFPGFTGRSGLSGRHRDRPARAAEPLDDAVPASSSSIPALDRVERAQRRALRDRLARLVRGARDGRMPDGLRNLGAFADPLRLADERVLAHRHRRYPHASPALRPPPEPEPAYEYVPQPLEPEAI